LAVVTINRIRIGTGCPLALIAGPCVIENRRRTLFLAREVARIASGVGIPFIFKASYDKANRTSLGSYRGPGLREGLKILAEAGQTAGVPVLTDVHSPQEACAAARVVDVIQIPAFLCRQTDLLVAAGETGKVVNIKKGQFMAPGDMAHAVVKVRSTGNRSVLLTERGATFGYHNLVVDFRALAIMRETGCPVVFDATHSVQLPGGAGKASAGERAFVAPLARAAVAFGVDALFLEVHDRPAAARSDGANMIPLIELERLLRQALAVEAALRKDRSRMRETTP
jgi:2-dehydro-3-deoxyphosphooctonate aldolase (KDO 8-P synthase)